MSEGQQLHHHHHHQRAPRTPESYFNVPESIALLNIVKSDRIQSAFQSNRKNHASVWELVADILSRYNNRKRSAKQCCNRYENLKKIYTQLKRNPEKHVRRNWPYMYLFRQIEEQRGESWGSASKRRNELSYYQRRRALMLINNNNINNNNNSNNNSNNRDSEAAFMKIDTNHLAQTELIRDCSELSSLNNIINPEIGKEKDEAEIDNEEHHNNTGNSITINLDNFEFGGLLNVKQEPQEIDYTDVHDKESPLFGRINNNYNGRHHGNNDDDTTNILHPDVIVDTDHGTDSSISCSIINVGSKRRKTSTTSSTDEESTNYELIEYLKRREKRDEEMFKRMENREDRLMKLLERTVVAIERIASQNYNNSNTNNNYHNGNNSFNNKLNFK